MHAKSSAQELAQLYLHHVIKCVLLEDSQCCLEKPPTEMFSLPIISLIYSKVKTVMAALDKSKHSNHSTSHKNDLKVLTGPNLLTEKHFLVLLGQTKPVPQFSKLLDQRLETRIYNGLPCLLILSRLSYVEHCTFHKGPQLVLAILTELFLALSQLCFIADIEKACAKLPFQWNQHQLLTSPV